MGVAILVAAVALAVVVAVAWPLLRERHKNEAPPDDHAGQALQDEIDRSLRAIREIDFDHRAGNLSDADFAELDGAERAQLATLLRRRDASLG